MEFAPMNCDSPNCSSAARVFTFKNSTKVKFCCDHMLASGLSKTSIFDIAGFSFISSPEDVPLYEERKGFAELGLGNISILEEHCKAELEASRKTIETEKSRMIELVGRCFREIEMTTVKKYEDVKAQFEELRSAFREFLESKDCRLPESAFFLCSSTTALPFFLRLTVADPSAPIAAALTSCWHLSPDSVQSAIRSIAEPNRTDFAERLASSACEFAQQGQIALAREAAMYAARLGHPGPNIEKQIQRQHADSLLNAEALFHLAYDDNSVRKAALAALKEGKAERQAGNYSECLVWLQSAWDLLQKYAVADETTVAVGAELGEVLCLHFAKYGDAEQVLSVSFDIEEKRSHLSEASMTLSILISGVYWHSERFSDTESLCQEILQTFRSTSQSAENWWTALFYLTLSLWQLGKLTDMKSLLDEWIAKPSQAETPRSTVLKLVALTRLAWVQHDLKEAERLHLQAKALACEHCPASVAAGYNLHLLGLLYKDMNERVEEERFFLEAKEVFATHYPSSILAANNLLELGLLYHSSLRTEEAEAAYLAARRGFAASAGNSLHAAVNSNNLGTLYDDMRRWEEAEKLYEEARTSFVVCAPVSDYAGNNLYNLALLYEALERYQAALSAAEAALEIYSKIGNEKGRTNACSVLMRLQGRSAKGWISRLLF